MGLLLGGPQGKLAHLFAVVSCIGHTHQLLVWPAIQVCILPADDAIASISRFAFTAVHGVTVVAQVVALGILVAVMCPICAGVSGLAYLRVHHPDVNMELSRVPRYNGNNNLDPYHLQVDRDPTGRVWHTSLLSHSLSGFLGFRQMLLYIWFS